MMTPEAPVESWLSWGGVHCVGPLGELSLDTMEACLGVLLVIVGGCHDVAAAPVAAVTGAGVPEKSSHLSGMTPRVTI